MGLDSSVIQECTRGSFAGTVTFPEVVQRLGAIGVERYDADLVRLAKTYYAASGETREDALPLEEAPRIAEELAEAGVREALAAVQRREIDYPEFLRRIMAAGTVAYSVFLAGRRAIYFGRKGDFWVERFPDRP